MGSVSLGFRGVELPADTAQQVLNSQTHEPSLPVWSPTDATPADPRRRKQNDPKTAPASPLRAVVHPPPSEAPQWHQDQAEMQDTTSHVPDGDPREHSYGKNIVIQPGAVYLGGVGRRGNATVDHCPGSMFSSGIEHCKMEQHHVPAPASDTHMSANRVAVTPRAQPLVAAHPQQEYHPPPLPISMPLGLPLSQGGFPPCQGTHEWQAAQEVRDSHQSIGEGVGRSEDHSNGSCSRVELPRQQHQPKLAESWADGVQLPMCGGQYDEMMHNDTPAPLPVVAPAAKARGQKRSAYARAMLNKRYRAGTGTLAFNLGLDGNLHQTRPSFTEPTDNGGWGIKSHAPLGVPSGQGWGSLSSSAADNLSGNVMAWTCGDGMGTLGNKPHVEMEGEALAYWERPRPGLAADAAHESRRKGDRPTASNDEQKTKAGAHNAIVAEVDDHASSPPSVKGSRLDPRSIHATKLLWGIGDITACFPSLQISETFTHAVASWSLLDTRRIGVMPMICHSLCSGPGSNTGGSGTTTKRDNSLKLGSDSVQHRRMPTDGSSHWEARVIVPYGALPDKAAAGDWANAIRLVLAEVSFDGATLAGLPGGKWDSDLDGGNPIEDDSSLIKTAVRTVRTAAGVDLGSCSTWIKFCELHHDTHTTVVFLCGGGISAIPQDKNGETSGLLLRSMHSLICEGSGQGNDGTTLESGEKAAMGATFEAILCTEFLWGLVSRDWTEVVQESLRVQALAEEEKTKSMNPAGMNAADNLKGALEVHPTIERPDEIRAAFELFDTCGAGRFSWEQLEAILVAGGVRLSMSSVKRLVSQVCSNPQGDTQNFYEYRQSLAEVPHSLPYPEMDFAVATARVC
ncbi:unnamed protein product [Discosporangium mesarthrocarpum]